MTTDRKLLAYLARCCELAYRDEDAVRRAMPEADIAFLQEGHAEAYAIAITGLGVIAVRGTQVTSGWSWKDVEANLRLELVSCLFCGGHVHAGYADAMSLLLPSVTEAVRRWRGEGRETWVTGHSLGGAVATLIGAAQVRITPGAVRGVASFGAPRCGDRAFAKAYPLNLLRVVHAQDIAPKLPFPLLFGYRHAGVFWHLSRAGELRRLRWWYPLHQLILPFTGTGVTIGILDHRVGEYVGKLRGAQ